MARHEASYEDLVAIVVRLASKPASGNAPSARSGDRDREREMEREIVGQERKIVDREIVGQIQREPEIVADEGTVAGAVSSIWGGEGGGEWPHDPEPTTPTPKLPSHKLISHNSIIQCIQKVNSPTKLNILIST